MKSRQVQSRRHVSHFAIGKLLALDVRQLDSCTMGDRALQLEIIDLFMDQLTGAQKKLSVAKFQVDEAKYMGHTLRGAALSIGAVEIAAIAAGWDELAFEQAELRRLLKQAAVRFKAAAGEFLQLS